MTPWAVEALGATRRDEKMDMLCDMVSQIVVHSRGGGGKQGRCKTTFAWYI